MEDDQNCLEDDRKKTEENTSISGRNVQPDCLAKDIRMVTTPPLKTGLLSGVDMVPDTTGESHSLSVVKPGTEPVQTRARNPTDRGGTDVSEESNPVRNTRTGQITVNGVNLMTLKKLKKPPVTKGNRPSDTKKKDNKKKNEMTVPSSGKITNYMVRKKGNEEEENSRLKTDNKEDNSKIEDKTNVEENKREEEKKRKLIGRKIPSVREDSKVKKTTFSPVQKTQKYSVKDNILRFQRLADRDECVVGSGRCSTHNTRLIRSVIRKKVSEVDSQSQIAWPIREVCILACPNKLDKQSSSEFSANDLVPAKSVGTNGIKKICFEESKWTNNTQ